MRRGKDRRGEERIEEERKGEERKGGMRNEEWNFISISFLNNVFIIIKNYNLQNLLSVADV